jgi:hypothetical protein
MSKARRRWVMFWESRRRRALGWTILLVAVLLISAGLLIDPGWNLRQGYRNTRVPAPLIPVQLSLQSATVSALSNFDSTSAYAKDVALDAYLSQQMLIKVQARIVNDDALWTSKAIPVCWEPQGNGYAQEKAWSRDAVATSWEAHSKIAFIGWQNCKPGDKGVHLQILDAPPEAQQLGKFLDGVPNGVLLNFEMKKAPIPCGTDRELCIREVAVHEFGHVLSFVHEDWQPGAPEKCKQLRQGAPGSPVFPKYDADSVMNYCNVRFANLGQLSAIDIAAVNHLYP